ncbi:AAA family ATPase, partial [Brachyspira sp.]|uniref:McrB family protein n=1 Tax=Brachyspira sp. TaxID=1977261 RepID=UPI002633B1E4
CEVADKVEDHCTWGDFVTEEDLENYKFGLEDEIHSVKVKNWIVLNKPIEYKNRGVGFISDSHNAYCKCIEMYEEGIKKMEIINILKQKKQIILQGAPGTGKTYSTAEIAVNLIDGKILDDRKEVMKRYNELIKNNQIFFTTFHQSMDYEEFVEGYKPVSNDGNIVYDVKDGIFKKACKYSSTAGNNKNNIEDIWNEFQNKLAEENIRFDEKNNNIGKLTLKTKTGLDFYLTTDDNGYVRYKPASQIGDNWRYIRAALYGLYFNKYKSALSYTEPLLDYLKENYNLSDIIENNENPVVLIIDEINRGNIAKIFGELITLLEADKRKNADNEIEVKLPYSKETFSVPNNLYIIGTMNTTDRSIGYIDYALRRRFAFITIKAEKEEIENFYNDKNYDCKDKALELFDNIKTNIINAQNLNEEFDHDDIMIGHSYFMAENEEELTRKLEYEIKPLLLEYYKDGILKNDKELKDKINKL